MLFYLVAWILLFFVCIVIGTAVLNLMAADCYDRPSDRAIISIWLGLVILAIALLGISLILPLSPIVGLGTVLLLVGFSLRWRSVRLELAAYYAARSRESLYAVGLIAIGVAAFSTREIAWFDTGLYHYGLIQWLSEFGTVPGIGLINARFGFTSSWFALLAPFDGGWLTAHTSAVANSFIFVLAIWQLLTRLQASCQAGARLADRFIAIFLLITLPIAFVIKFPWLMTVSTAPDFPLILLVGIVSWAILLITHQSDSDNQEISKNEQSEQLFNVRLVPLTLAAGAMSIKLNGVVLVPIVGLFYLVVGRLNWQRVTIALGLSFLLLIPMFIFGYIVIGFPLFPLTLFRINFPWTIKEDFAKNLAAIPNPWVPEEEALSLLERIREWLVNMSTQWLFFEKLNILIPVLLLVSIMAGIQILQRFRQRKFAGSIWLLLIGGTGAILVMSKSPLMRHGLGYFALLPAYLLATQWPPFLNDFYASRLNINAHSLNRLLSLGLLAALTCSIAIFVTIGHWQYLLLPARLPREALQQAQINDVIYYHPPESARCWAGPLPCSPGPIQHDIKLRDPDLGIGGGFVYREWP
ncbi:LIC_10190 family membrane protein [Trichothermofontia sp.]